MSIEMKLVNRIKREFPNSNIEYNDNGVQYMITQIMT